MLVTLSGPAVNLGLAAAALFAYGSLPTIGSWSIPFMPFACFAVANLWMLFVNLVPRYYKTAHGKLPSDGLSLLRLPFSSKADIDQNIVFYYALEGLELRKKDQLNEAIQWYQKALSIYPGDTRLLNDYAVALIDCERFDEAKALCNQIIEKQASDPGVMAIVHNNIAYLNILLGEKALLEEADTASSHAFASWPWIPAIKGTRGMVLVELGRIDEGIRLLKEALERSEGARQKAINAAYLAVAEARKGNRIRAQQYLETATQYHFDHPLIERAKNESSNQSLNAIPPVLLSPG
jgi:tetratricopeptide (TPR) repeat protein